MPKGFYKKSRYEILAIFREDYRVKSMLVLHYKDVLLQLTLKKIDSHFFYVEMASFTPREHVEYNFMLHSQLGKLEFSTYLFMDIVGNQQKKIYRFKIPDKIKISQRRVSPRIMINNQSQFYISGLYENGDSYKFIINDISEGGFSFVANSYQIDLINKGKTFNNVEVILSEYGRTVTSFKVVSITDLYAEQNSHVRKARISCSFCNNGTETSKFFENAILQLTIDKKNKARRF